MSEPSPPVPPTYELPHPVEVYVVAPRPRQRYWIHILLLLATVFTTLVVGARLQFNFQHDLPAFTLDENALSMFPVHWIFTQPSRLLTGIPFALTLMGILLAHEMGHYVYCVRYQVNATLPFFIPAPTLIGTLGAFIRIKAPIRSRDALFDIGIAGPIAGFVVAALVLLWSLTLSKPMAPGAKPSDVQLGFPLIFYGCHWLLAHVFPAMSGPGKIPLQSVFLHPTAIAAWVGMFATALNLLPGGQLDGGHLVYALAPRLHRVVTRGTVAALLMLGLIAVGEHAELFLPRTHGWEGWLIWAVVIAFTGMRHPQVPPWPGLGRGRKWLAALALAMLVLTFAPAPIVVNSY